MEKLIETYETNQTKPMKTNEANEAAGRSRPWESFPTTSPTSSFLSYLCMRA